jgi:DASS family divalent anion:Na+ symporter
MIRDVPAPAPTPPGRPGTAAKPRQATDGAPPATGSGIDPTVLWAVAAGAASLAERAAVRPARPASGETVARAVGTAVAASGTLAKLAAGLLLALLTAAWFAPVPVSSPAAWRTAILLLGAVAAWAVAIVPEYAVALALVTLYNVSHVGAATVSLSGFATPSWFLLLATLGLGTALAKSGLLTRVALRLLALFPPTFQGQSAALLLGGIAVTPLFPLTVARCSLAGPLTASLAGALGFRPGTREAAGLGLAAFVGSGLMSRTFLSGATLNLVAWGLLPQEARLGWGDWLVAAVPSTVIVVVGTLAAIRFAYMPAEDRPLSKEVIRERLVALGPVSRAELWAGGVAVAMLGGFVAGPRVGIETAWVGCGGVFVLAASGVLTKEQLRQGVDWPLLVFLGVVLSLPAMLAHVGLDLHLAAAFSTWAGSLEVGPREAIALLFAATTAARFVLSEWVAVPVLTMAFLPAAPALGLHPWVAAYIVLVGANLWLLPYQFTSYLTFVSGSEGKLFEHRQVSAFGAVYLALALGGLLASIPLWRALGLLG